MHIYTCMDCLILKLTKALKLFCGIHFLMSKYNVLYLGSGLKYELNVDSYFYMK